LIGTIAITDEGWYEFLSARDPVHEVNFWSPSPRRAVRAQPFSPFFFKLRSPSNAICGFAYYAKWSALPDWLAWECFQERNGCASLQEMRKRLAEIRQRIRFEPRDSLGEIGCTLLVHPTFFRREDWIRQPSDWPIRTQNSKKYDLETSEGARIWRECMARESEVVTRIIPSDDTATDDRARFGTPQLVARRLGQGIFRVNVMDAYERACAVTGEHSLPALVLAGRE
jgi:putative restriction endonuclease